MGNVKSKSSTYDGESNGFCFFPSFFSNTDPKSKLFVEEKQPQEPPFANYPTPKHMLWGCETPQEHYEVMEETLQKIENQTGTQGLKTLDLEFKFWHNPKTCKCDKSLNGTTRSLSSNSSSLEDTNKSGAPKDNFVFQHQESLAESSLGSDDMEGDDAFFEMDIQDDHGDDDDDASLYEHHEPETYMVPLTGDSLQMEREDSITDLRGFANTNLNLRESERSATTMFSLATHHTFSSNSVLDDNINHPCQMRLWHAQLQIPITEQNHEHFLAHGKMYNEIARLCMEAAQEIMKELGDLEWQEIRIEDTMNYNIPPPKVLVSKLQPQDTSTKSKKTLLVITGKGEVRAGIFSRRHLITTGVEASTAITYLREARSRNMRIVILDPNAQGSRYGMQIVEETLNHVFQKGDQDVYVLAHSMAGSQLVRYLLQQQQQQQQQDSNNLLLNQIQAIAFTDSNHNIQWTKSHDVITNLLVGPASIYLKSHKLHDDEPKRLGQLQGDCNFWSHRFGSIKTVWAGTHEHALTNYTSREYIWDHFDSIMDEQEEL